MTLTGALLLLTYALLHVGWFCQLFGFGRYVVGLIVLILLSLVLLS